MFFYLASLNININVDVRELNCAVTLNPPAHYAHKEVLATQTNTASKSCRFISVCNNHQWAKGPAELLLTKVKTEISNSISKF